MNNTIPFHSATHAPQITVDVNILTIQELMKAQKNVEMFFAEEKVPKEKAQTR